MALNIQIPRLHLLSAVKIAADIIQMKISSIGFTAINYTTGFSATNFR